MAAALAGEYPVLTAATPASALGLIARHGPCGAAFCHIPGDPLASLACAEQLTQACPGIVVTTLLRPPCPNSLLCAMADGRIDDIGLLPLSPEALRRKADHALSGQRRRRSPDESPSGILTREEVEFLLGRDRDPAGPSSQASH